ncbi:hypothetical protein C8J46_11413 [Sphingomonas sp. PP-F2F-A104-K0414]|nr:hypothetical protein C8J46_11413 [Sphingomonas sp. PP-F2F-A104-K0414]
MAFSQSSRLGRVCVAPELCDLALASDETWTTMQNPAGQDYDFFATIRMRDKLIGWAIIFTPLLAMLLLLKLCYRPEPIEPRYVYGCYASNVAPRILIDERLISFDNSRLSPTSYEVRAEKQGYSIYMKANIILDRTTGGQFAFVTSPYGTSLPLLPEHYSEPRYLRHLSEFSGKFYVFSRQADEVVYSRMTPKGACLTQPNAR